MGNGRPLQGGEHAKLALHAAVRTRERHVRGPAEHPALAGVAQREALVRHSAGEPLDLERSVRSQPLAVEPRAEALDVDEIGEAVGLEGTERIRHGGRLPGPGRTRQPAPRAMGSGAARLR